MGSAAGAAAGAVSPGDNTVMGPSWVNLARHTSVPIPKFARSVGTLSCELRNQRDPSKYIILVRFLGFEVPMRASD